MPRAVQLEHETVSGSVHVDWLFERREGEARVRSFRLRTRIDALPPDEALRGEAMDDHRRLYLDFEGELSGGRGTVRQVASGEVVSVREEEGWIEVAIDWGRGAELIRGERTGAGAWMFRRADLGTGGFDAR